MRNKVFFLTLSVLLLCSCGGVNKALKSTDLDYRYETAKQLFMRGHYNDAALLLNDAIAGMKGTERGDEALFLLGMSKFFATDYVAANDYLSKYYKSYPTGAHVEEAHFYCGYALYLSTPNANLDQTDTYLAITEFNNFLDDYPNSKYANQTRNLIFEMQDKLIDKQYNAAKLYFNLGGYFGNCTMGGSNYEACIITAQNAVRDYPYSKRKEDFAILILRAKYELAVKSVKEKMKDRYNDTLDEYYGFVNEYPESKYMEEAKKIYEKSQLALK